MIILSKPLDDIERCLKYHSSPRGLLQLLKENVTNITNGIETIKKLRPVNFDWTNDYADAEGMYIM